MPADANDWSDFFAPGTAQAPTAAPTPTPEAAPTESPPSAATPTSAPETSSTIDNLAESIAAVETHGRKDAYTVLGKPSPKTGDQAHGKYQIMGTNIPSWTEDATGKWADADEFLKNPDLQDRTARYKIKQIYDKHGNVRDVASVWHSNLPYDQATKTGSHDFLGKSTKDYADEVAAEFERRQAAAAQPSPTTPTAPETTTAPDAKPADDWSDYFAASTAAKPAAAAETQVAEPTLAELEQKRAIAPIVEGVKSGTEALAGGEVNVPLYGKVPAATADETLAESAERAPARLGAALVRVVPPIINAPGEAIGGAPVQKLTGSETAGDVASVIVNMLAPWLGAKALGVGAATSDAIEAAQGVTSTEKAGAIAQEAVPRAYKTAKAVADAHYNNAAALAEEAGSRVLPKHLAAVQKDANEFISKAGSSLTGRARELVENIATHPGDVSYSDWNTLSHELGDMALSPEQHAIADDFVKKGLTRLYRGTRQALQNSVEGTPAGEELATANEKWNEVSDLRKLTKRVAGSKTGTEAARALGDPARERAAMETMTDAEKDAYGVLRRAAAIQKGAPKATGALLAIEGGRLLFNPPEGYKGTLTEAAGTALLGAAVGNPKIALLIARGIRTPAAAAAATKVLNSLAGYAGEATRTAGETAAQ